MNRIKNILPLLIILFTVSVQAQENLSLSDAITLALEYNYDLQITRQSEEISGINNDWGNTGIMPSINFNLNGRENFNINDNENYRTQTIAPDLSLSWVFFDGFSAKITKQKFEQLEQQSQGNTAILIESTIQNIIVAYNACVLQKEMLDVYKELAGLSEDRYRRTEDSKEIGASTTYEMLQAKTSWLEDQSNYLQQQVNYENAVRTLNFNMAVVDDKMWNFTTALETNTPDYLLEDLKGKLVSNNKTLKNQYLNQSLLAKETELAKSNMYPKLSLNTGVGNTWMDNYYSGSTPNVSLNSMDAYFGLSLSFNIFNGGIARRSVQIAQIKEETEQIQTDQMTHSLNNQLLQMYSNYNVQKAILELANEKETTAKLNLDLSADKFKSGVINSFNYRDVQIIYMNAAIAKFQAIYNLIESNTDLLRITGGIINEYE
ncbi:TolC family protein [Prolixibacteraceae bacterium Z1-6]|uniref:TolC family protein n=1 Tax=Draconibacterium aestuarii TaxID=2998507 RepID=A0A9X3F3J5_9BACT|nr:TolC family protein [Prolixibacteraceae bacterium Z1-6]